MGPDHIRPRVENWGVALHAMAGLVGGGVGAGHRRD